VEVIHMKKVFNVGEVPHIWAQRSQPEGRGGAIYFRGDVLFDYGEHFVLGAFVTNESGQVAVLLNSRDYSITTQKHKTWTWRAVSNYETFSVPIPERHNIRYNRKPTTDDISEWFSDYRDRIQAALDKGKRARVYADSHYGRAMRLIDEARRFAQFFGLTELAIELPENASIEDMRRYLDESTARQMEAVRRKHAGEVEKFLSGEIDSVNPAVGTFLRVRGEQVQTSQNANVPVDHAERLYRMWKSRKVKQGERVGHYTVSGKLSDGGLRIGCHEIPATEIERFAQSMGWAE
jgi:hypothetical protein